MLHYRYATLLLKATQIYVFLRETLSINAAKLARKDNEATCRHGRGSQPSLDKSGLPVFPDHTSFAFKLLLLYAL